MPSTEIKVKLKNVAGIQRLKGIVGISLNGNQYSTDEVTALLETACKFRSCIVVLHGDDETCAAWREKNTNSVDKFLHLATGTKELKIINWTELQRDEECQAKYTEFQSFSVRGTPEADDFSAGIEETAREYQLRHPDVSYEDASAYILEEMAFLTSLAFRNQTDCFVYKGEELTAFYVTKKHFFPGSALLQWAELEFSELKPKKEKRRNGDIERDVSVLEEVKPRNVDASKITRLKDHITAAIVELLTGFQTNFMLLEEQIKREEISPEEVDEIRQKYTQLIQDLYVIRRSTLPEYCLGSLKQMSGASRCDYWDRYRSSRSPVLFRPVSSKCNLSRDFMPISPEPLGRSATSMGAALDLEVTTGPDKYAVQRKR